MCKMKKTAFFTMDVESFSEISCLRETPRAEYDDFRIEYAIDDYLDLLEKYGIKATFFVLCSSLEHTREYLRRAVKEGHEIALHGLTHELPAQINKEELKKQLFKGKELLEKEFGTKITGYRAPCFAVTDEVLEVIEELGFEYDSSRHDVPMKYYTATANFDGFKEVSGGILQRRGFYEIPPCQVKTFGGTMSVSGGGYMRLAPYSVVLGGLKKFLKASDYYVFYCHPAEIFTGKPPNLKGVSLLNSYFIKAGRKNFLNHTENIIKVLQDNGYSFSTMCDFLKNKDK